MLNIYIYLFIYYYFFLILYRIDIKQKIVKEIITLGMIRIVIKKKENKKNYTRISLED